MKKILIAQEIDFADSELRNIEMLINQDVVIYIDAWNAKTIKMFFSEFIYFKFNGGFQISDSYEIINSPLLKNTLALRSEILEKAEYRHFEIESLYDSR